MPEAAIPNNPYLSMIMEMSSCPAIMSVKDRVAPMRGTSVVAILTKNAPINPPDQIHQGAPLAPVRSKGFCRIAIR